MDEQWDVSKSHHPYVRQVVADKIRGLFVGSALGDAIGLYTEFLDGATCKNVYPSGSFTLTGDKTRFHNDSHRTKFLEGSWTDDTDHALLILLSYLHSNGQELSSLDFAKRLRSWVEQGLRCLDRLPLGLGQTVGRVVVNNTYLENPKSRALQAWANGNFTAAPNGSLMRTHPLGAMCIGRSLSDTFDVATDFCLVTHADPRCIVSCCIATGLVRGLLLGNIVNETNIDDMIEKAAVYVEGLSPHDPPLVSAIGESPPAFDRAELLKHAQARTYEDLGLDDLRKQGYVYKCLGAGILCLRQVMQRTQPDHSSTINADGVGGEVANVHMTMPSIFEDLITDLIMRGGDADTNATVAGAFLGAFLGFSYLPPHWYNGVKDINWLVNKADAMVQVLKVDDKVLDYKHSGSQDKDTLPDGGKGFLDEAQLKEREMAFMEMYLTKTGHGREMAQRQAASKGSAGLMKKWKKVFG